MTHRHQCPRRDCGAVWEHDRVALVNMEAFLAGHRCPKCGAEQFLVLMGEPFAPEPKRRTSKGALTGTPRPPTLKRRRA